MERRDTDLMIANTTGTGATTREVPLLVAGGPSDGQRWIQVQPGMTVNDVLQQQQLEGYQLSVGQGKPFLAMHDNVYDLIGPGEKLFATTIARQGEADC